MDIEHDRLSGTLLAVDASGRLTDDVARAVYAELTVTATDGTQRTVTYGSTEDVRMATLES